jgi:hypothetical protein
MLRTALLLIVLLAQVGATFAQSTLRLCVRDDAPVRVKSAMTACACCQERQAREPSRPAPCGCCAREEEQAPPSSSDGFRERCCTDYLVATADLILSADERPRRDAYAHVAAAPCLPTSLLFASDCRTIHDHDAPSALPGPNLDGPPLYLLIETFRC